MLFIAGGLWDRIIRYTYANFTNVLQKKKSANMMWATKYGDNMHKWVTRGVQDMRDNTNLHDYMDGWRIYLRLCLTVFFDKGHVSGIWSWIPWL